MAATATAGVMNTAGAAGIMAGVVGVTDRAADARNMMLTCVLWYAAKSQTAWLSAFYTSDNRGLKSKSHGMFKKSGLEFQTLAFSFWRKETRS